MLRQCGEAHAGLSRDKSMEVPCAENVPARRYFYPGVHKMAPYLARGVSLPQTDRICVQVLSLPTGTAVQSANIETICQIIRLAVAHADHVRTAVQARHRRAPTG